MIFESLAQPETVQTGRVSILLRLRSAKLWEIIVFILFDDSTTLFILFYVFFNTFYTFYTFSKVFQCFAQGRTLSSIQGVLKFAAVLGVHERTGADQNPWSPYRSTTTTRKPRRYDGIKISPSQRSNGVWVLLVFLVCVGFS